MCRVVGIYVRWNGTRTDTKIQTYRTVLCTEFCASVVHDSKGLRLYRSRSTRLRSRPLPPPPQRIATLCAARAASSAARRSAASRSGTCTVKRTSVGMATLDAMVWRVAVLVAGGYGRRTAPVARTRNRAPKLNRFVLSTKIVVRGTAHCRQRRVHSHFGDGQREGDARLLGLSRVRCRAQVVNCSSSAPLVVTWIS